MSWAHRRSSMCFHDWNWQLSRVFGGFNQHFLRPDSACHCPGRLAGLAGLGCGLVPVGYFCRGKVVESRLQGLLKTLQMRSFLVGFFIYINVMRVLLGRLSDSPESSIHLCGILIFKQGCRFFLHVIMVCNVSQSSKSVTKRVSHWVDAYLMFLSI